MEMPLVPLTSCSPSVRASLGKELHEAFPSEVTSPVIDDDSSAVRFWVRLNADAVVACFSIQYEPADGFTPCIGHLYVSPAHRGQGIGKALLEDALQILSSEGWDTAYLWCRPALSQYYRDQGWSIITQSLDVIVMSCPIQLATGFASPYDSVSSLWSSPW